MAGAVRSQPRRSAARSAASLPYSRRKQAPAKKSPWAIATGLLSFLNPLRRSESPSPIDVDEYDDEPTVDLADDDVSDDSPPESLSARGRQMAHNLNAPPMHQPPPVAHLLPETSSPQKNLETVKTFLEQRRGQTISPLEAEGLISLIQKSTPAEPEKPEPFRFSSSVPSTPARGNSPANELFTLGSSPARSASPRKTLAKNPNGTLHWSGAGSARPSKNRYASPAFGSPSRASSEHLVFQESPSKSTTTDASPKRRRLETPPASTPPPPPRSAAPGPSPNRVAATQHFPFPISTPAASPVTPGLAKSKTMPVNPSPLRQAWGNSPASSVSSSQSSPAHGTPTKAATLLTALIRDADADVPKRSLDVRNPYQSASPVGIRVTNTHPPEVTRKRTRATGRPTVAERQKEKEEQEKAEQEQKEKEKKEKEREVVPPQAIMEATLPKGSKRSRPPAHFNASASLNSLAAPSLPSTRRSPRLEPQRIQVDELEDEKDKDKEERDAGAPAAKRVRGPAVNGAPTSTTNGTTKKDVPVAPTPVPAPATASQPFTFPASNSAPSVFGNTGDANKPVFTMGSSASSSTLGTTSSSNATPPTSAFEFRLGPKPLATAPKEPSKLRYSFQPPPTPPPVADKSKEEKEKRALFPMDPPPVPSPKSSAFPGFGPPLKNTFAPAPAPATKLAGPQDPKAAARAMPVMALPSFVFTVLTNAPAVSAHVKARDAARKLHKALLPSFDFTTPFTAAEKGKGKEVAAPVQGFNWAAAGVAPPKSKAAVEGAWTCNTCMLSNGPEAKEKCSVCEAPRAPPPAPPAVKGFNWAAAGAAAPKAEGAEGSWTCGTCMLRNGPEVKEKCGVCDSPR
ncbi:hypothetical protein C8R46DRAFT_121564 [Mycena filopes]|nr:hypothetical protein C8R46DRAFT_121564 [Mycena filopes]